MRAKRRSRLALIAGLLFIVIAIAGVAYPLWWNHRSKVGGEALLSQATSQLTAKHSGVTTSCPKNVTSAVTPAANTPGILQIPSLGITAPVENGVSDAVLDVAVGHAPATTWPGGNGESIVEAHDVSYFSGLSHVKAGDMIVWITPCARSQFKVLTTSIHNPGDVINAPSSGTGLALVTCYPTNALFWTNQRFVVTTQLVGTVIARQSLPTTASIVPHLKVPAPMALVAQGLALNQNSLYMGVMQLAGKPAPASVAGPGPLKVEADALSVFFGAKKAVQQRNATWWADLTVPGVPFRSSWPIFGQANVMISVAGATPTSIVITSGAASVTIVNRSNVLLISKITG